ncbi:MAG TPA: terminase small subunit [Anaerolineae bacterium]|nr:terminase small subunit [Anaerolineae bacterium]HOR00988.1 terminase small subunit [Anaerolineae bacterium]HPL30645.1 terminase small subunit [Anaerolineae bacterium]
MGKAKLTRKQFIWLTFYLGEARFNATEAARLAGYKTPRCSGPENLHKPAVIEAIAQWWATKAMATDETMGRLAEIARGDLGQFFKVAEVWLENPLPSHEIKAEREEVDDKGEKHVKYLCRQIVLDVDKLTDPQFSRLVRKFADSPRNGLSVELHDPVRALELIGKDLGRFRDTIDVREVDLSKLNDEQLERIAKGEDPIVVLAAASQGRDGTAAADGAPGEPTA